MQTQKNILFVTSTITDGNMSFRFGDNIEVVENRRRFLEENGGDYADCVPMLCNHGSTITSVNRGNSAACLGPATQARMLETEVLLTNEKGLVLMLLTADCIPAAFYDPTNQAIALAHLNRHTIAFDLGQQTVLRMQKKFDTNPAELTVYFGPHIKKESYCYALPFKDQPPAQLASYITKKDDHAFIDLTEAFIARLEDMGVLRDHVVRSSIDTGTDDQYFSHYRSKHDSNHPEGRLASILMLR